MGTRSTRGRPDGRRSPTRDAVEVEVRSLAVTELKEAKKLGSWPPQRRGCSGISATLEESLTRTAGVGGRTASKSRGIPRPAEVIAVGRNECRVRRFESHCRGVWGAGENSPPWRGEGRCAVVPFTESPPRESRTHRSSAFDGLTVATALERQADPPGTHDRRATRDRRPPARRRPVRNRVKSGPKGTRRATPRRAPTGPSTGLERGDIREATIEGLWVMRARCR